MRFTLALVMFALAAAVQFWLMGGGIFLNLIFALLVVYALYFDFWELAFFVLLAMFLLDWRSAITLELALVAAVPFAVFAMRGMFRMETWVTAPIGIVAGLLLLYAVAAPRFLWTEPAVFLADACLSLLAGMLAFAALHRSFKYRAS